MTNDLPFCLLVANSVVHILEWS